MIYFLTKNWSHIHPVDLKEDKLFLFFNYMWEDTETDFYGDGFKIYDTFLIGITSKEAIEESIIDSIKCDVWNLQIEKILKS